MSAPAFRPMTDSERKEATRRAKARRERELEACGRYFSSMIQNRDLTPTEQFTRDTAIWSKYRQGIPLTPLEALRLPRLVPQPKAWVQEFLDGVSRDKG